MSPRSPSFTFNRRIRTVRKEQGAIQPSKEHLSSRHALVRRFRDADERYVNYMLGKDAQATTYDTGYFYPGPAVKDVTLAMAPEDSQNVIKEFGRPEYEAAIKDNPQELPLTPDKLVYAFSRWDEQIGAQKKK